ncbi:hypothetical protein [Methylobacterium sp. 10]|uniref:hypothetical protein n=1 Tax=Methylobacterium sp. 10 TaxID=1101191 RepID=UPI00047F2B9C|nr:hypothetical protein [Methylobacterium sp. 10]
MERYIVRFIKPVALAVITFASVYFLTGSSFIALIVSSIPLLLGWLGIMETFAYGMAATVFISAVVWAVVPADMKVLVGHQATVFAEELRKEADKGMNPKDADKSVKEADKGVATR